jgi:quercetin dioxygenase-like cupin family protein
MYEQIHNDLLAMLKAKKDFRLMDRRLNLGRAIQQIKNNKRLSFHELTEKTGIQRNSLDTAIAVGEVNTTQERFTRLLKGLGVSSDEFIHVARETAHYNFYHLKGNEAPLFKYRTHEVEVYSPPTFSRKDFLWCLVRIYSGKQIQDLTHQTMDQVAGFVTNGHLNFKYGDKTYSIHTNQSFFFDPKISHSFKNNAHTGTTDFYLCYCLKPVSQAKEETRGRKPLPTSISTKSLIRQIRKELSPNPERLLPMPALAGLSGISLNSLMHISYRKTKIIPFEKIDRLANLTNDSFENIIQKLENRYQGWVEIFTDQDKVSIDLSSRQGVRLISHAGIGIGKRKFTISDMTFDSWKKSESRKEWQFQGIGFIGISIQRGCVGIQYGNQPIKVLTWGEFLYFNADVKFSLSNIISEEEARERGESPEAKVTLFTCPSLF